MELKDNPLRPGEPAMILYREIQTDSAKSLETHFTRIKIFKQAGKKYADVEIPYFEKEIEVQNIQGRTIKPDGQAIDFGGTVYDRVVAKSKRLKINVKSFAFPDVQPGSINCTATIACRTSSKDRRTRGPCSFSVSGS
jgi:hypothetical protein